MTEAQWLASDDLARMLYVVQGPEPEYGGFPTRKASKRKLRLWVQACWDAADARARDHTKRLRHGFSLTVALGYWTSRDTEKVVALPLRAALLRDVVGNPFRPVKLWPLACASQSMIDECLRLAEAAYEGRAVRHVYVGDHSGVPCYENMPDGALDPARLGVLADALEEAGCEERLPCPFCRAGCGYCGFRGYRDDPHPVVAHLRSPGPHVRGCWAVDLILGRA